MNSKEFTYWFKGAIDLSNIKSLDKYQTANLKDYLETVNNEVTPLDSFPSWLKGYFDMVNPTEIKSEDFKKIVTKLYKSLEPINQNTSHFDSNHDMSVYPPGVRPKC